LRSRLELQAKVLLLEMQVAMYEEADAEARKTASRLQTGKDSNVKSDVSADEQLIDES